MTENEINNTNIESPKKNTISSFFNSPLFIIILILAGLAFVFRDLQRFGYILIVLMGFGGVVLVHELGHFLAAKSVGILVEAFAIGMGPVLVGVKRIGNGFRFRILPRMGADVNSPEGKGLLCITIPTAKKVEGDTEYQIRILPIGGFVKMLGQEDMGTVEHDNNPRSFVNKGFWQRIWVISAGVIMNVVSGGLLFISVFAHGVDLPPAVIGKVLPDSPAAKAGIQAGDKVIAINGESKDLFTFTELMMAAAFADKDEAVKLKVSHPNGSIEDFEIKPEMNAEMGIQMLGVAQSESLTIARPKEKQAIEALKNIGFAPGDKIVAVNGRPIQRADQLLDILYQPPQSNKVDTTEVNVTIQRKDQERETILNVPIKIELASSSETSAVLGIVPRLQVIEVLPGSPAETAGIESGDIVLQAGTIFYPDKTEFSEIVVTHGGKSLPLKLLRTDVNGDSSEIELALTPEWREPSLRQRLTGSNGKPIIGIIYAPADTMHPIVGTCIKSENSAELDKKDLPHNKNLYASIDLPRGAKIVAVGDNPVQNYRDLIAQLGQCKGQNTVLSWIPYGEETPRQLTVSVPSDEKWIGLSLQPDFGKLSALPLKPLELTFKGQSIKENLELGLRTSWTFIAQTYVMIKGMIHGTIGMKAASGPVGILKMSYTIASERPLVYYLYFMATISMAIAVFNFLPLPIVDGGLVVILIIEKIKGSPLSIKTQEIINYAGLALLGSFALFVTFQDIWKIISGQM